MRNATFLPIALVVSLGCAAQEQEYPEAVAADPDHYALEAENDAVRILRVTYGPGERSVMHSHPPLCSVALGPSSWQMTDVSGEVTEDSGSFGDVECVDGTVHIPENSGTSPSEVVLIELKEGAMAPQSPMASEYPDAVSADPDHYSVEFENDVIRLLRIAYGPGERSAMHYHPANCYVSLSAGTWRMTDAEGGMAEVETPLGQVQCADAEVHLPENLGNEAGGVILLELKGRETFDATSGAM